jgi:hypothetical protein
MPQKAGSESSWCDFHGLNHIAEHGSASTYTNHRCRCVDCTAEWARKHKEWCHQRNRRGIPAHVHGSVNGYTNYRCRCARCRDANTQARRESDERARSKRLAAQGGSAPKRG